MIMYSVLVVDDEIRQREAVIGNVDWQRAGFEVVGGAEIRNGNITLSQLSEIACEKKTCEIPESGRQEKIQSEINQILFK